MAPETIQGYPSTTKADVFSYGVYIEVYISTYRLYYGR